MICLTKNSFFYIMKYIVRVFKYPHREIKKRKKLDMSKESVRKIRKIYGICMAVYSGIVGLLFIIQVWSIFLSTPNDPYTRASIAAAFQQIAVPVWIWVVVLIAGAFIPHSEKTLRKAYVSSQIQLDRLYKRVNVTEEITKKTKALKIIRIVLVCLQILVWAAAIIVGIVLLTMNPYQPVFPIEFFKEHNGLVDRLICLLPWLLNSMAVSVAATLVADFTRKKEIAVLKEALISKAKTAEKTAEQCAQCQQKQRFYLIQ